MYAHLYHSRQGYELWTSDTPAMPYATMYCTVKTRREAREICAKHGFKPWNF